MYQLVFRHDGFAKGMDFFVEGEICVAELFDLLCELQLDGARSVCLRREVVDVMHRIGDRVLIHC